MNRAKQRGFDESLILSSNYLNFHMYYHLRHQINSNFVWKQVLLDMNYNSRLFSGGFHSCFNFLRNKIPVCSQNDCTILRQVRDQLHSEQSLAYCILFTMLILIIPNCRRDGSTDIVWPQGAGTEPGWRGTNSLCRAPTVYGWAPIGLLFVKFLYTRWWIRQMVGEHNRWGGGALP